MGPILQSTATPRSQPAPHLQMKHCGQDAVETMLIFTGTQPLGEADTIVSVSIHDWFYNFK
jgi:hypothetical protein